MTMFEASAAIGSGAASPAAKSVEVPVEIARPRGGGHGAYRHEIDGLRALAVLAVIVFHLGFLPNGYLGVDVFFVISGYLITGIIHREVVAGRFSLRDFYLRRTRRIIPLTLFVGAVALGVGLVTMLPDDLENLAQSVIATNLFANNILQAITTKNYWSVVNEYKPLMQTWSLGVEEQYYLLYPMVFLIFAKVRRSWLLPVISLLAVGSLALYLGPSEEHEKFYFIQFRFWELAIGGIAALGLKRLSAKSELAVLPVLVLVAVMVLDTGLLPRELLLVSAVLATVAVLILATEGSRLLNNWPMVWIGKLSFSLYLWHQVVIAYVRYVWTQEFDLLHIVAILTATGVLSVLTYNLVEQPFRNPARVATPVLLAALAAVFVLTTGASAFVYANAGVVRDVPELGIARADAERNMHGRYNDRIYGYDRPFQDAAKLQVLVIGNSYARDWANVLLESRFADEIELSYMFSADGRPEFADRASDAEVLFYAVNVGEVPRLDVSPEKLYVVGPKNFGTSNGIFYNNRGPGYYNQRTSLAPGYLEKNLELRQEWGESRFVDLIGAMADGRGTVPVFTPDGRFISQDCYHLTQAGAQYFARLLDRRIAGIIAAGGALAESTHVPNSDA